MIKVIQLLGNNEFFDESEISLNEEENKSMFEEMNRN